MEKIIVDTTTTKKIIKHYIEESMGMAAIGKLYNVSRTVVKRVLEDNDVTLTQPGQKFKGGKPQAQKRYEEKNKIKRSTYHAEWRKDKGEELKAYQQQWREENKEQWLKTKREYERRRKKEDGVYKLVANFRTAIYTALKEQHAVRYVSNFKALGYTREQLADHLESLFQEGMSWENYGKWHVDHSKPISLFTFKSTTDPEFKKCWALSNLQPMWGPENMSKGNRY